MGHFRYRKSISLIPGVRLNLSKTGASVSVGRAGSTVNFNQRGLRSTLGIPGSGLSYVEQQKWSKTGGNGGTNPFTYVMIAIAIAGVLIKLLH